MKPECQSFTKRASMNSAGNRMAVVDITSAQKFNDPIPSPWKLTNTNLCSSHHPDIAVIHFIGCILTQTVMSEITFCEFRFGLWTPWGLQVPTRVMQTPISTELSVHIHADTEFYTVLKWNSATKWFLRFITYKTSHFILKLYIEWPFPFKIWLGWRIKCKTDIWLS